MIKRTIITALTIVAMVGCQKDNNVEESNSPLAVQFSSSDISTRVIEDATDGSFSWVEGDKVGITATAIYDNYTITFFSNVSYSAASSGSSTNFEIADGDCITISQGMDNSFVFNAFYPYSDDENITIDVSDQSDLSKLIYLTATTTQYMSYFDSNDPVVFTFNNLLSKVTLNIEFDSSFEIDDNTTMSATMFNAITESSFNVATLTPSLSDTYENIALNCVVDSDNNKATITALLLPSSLCDDTKIRFNIGGDIYNTTYYKDLESGNEYLHKLILSDDGEVIIE